MTMRELRRVLDPIRNKIRLLITRAALTRIVDTAGIQVIQVKGLPGETLDGIERFQNYGFTSVPLPGAESIIVFVGGSRSHGVAVANDDRRHRKKNLQPGESAQYSDEGDFIHLKRGKIIAVTSGGQIKVTAPKVNLVGVVEVTLDGAVIKLDATGAITIDGGTVILTGTTTIEGRVFLAHTHSGVETGAGVSGPVV